MSLQFLPKMKWKPAALILAVSLFVCVGAVAQNTSTVQTYTNQAVPPTQQNNASYGTPLSAGTMTLEDVLETHPLPKKQPLQAPTLAPGQPAPAPVAVTPVQASSESDMLMQGMRSVLQQSGSPSSVLKAPRLPGAAPANNPSPFTPPVAAAAAGTANGVQYQPGQAPKNLATNGPLNVAPSPLVAEQAFVSEPTPETQTPEVPATPPTQTTQTTDGGAKGACEPHTEKWVKTCEDAGYPASYVGQIRGETHVTCPSGTLQDVWVTNSCASSDGSDAEAPLTAPAPQTASSLGTASGPDVDGACGPANGLAAQSKPSGDLCVAGDVGNVTGDGPWRWDCRGIGSGMTVSCAAASTVASISAGNKASTETVASATPSAIAAIPSGFEDGECGVANETGTTQAPTEGLCAKGLVSRVSGSGPWTWACSGRNGGQAAACSAAKVTDGLCGSASGAGADSMPMENLCAAGYASAITGSGPWNWTCSGLYGGAPALCSATPKQDAVCGTSSLYGHREAPHDNLCSIGQASSVNGGGPWTWTCNGANGGSPVSCVSPISVNGGCGAANGVAITSVPAANLCAHGVPTRVTGEGPWQWNCSGTDGGDTQSCAAPLGQATTPAPVAASAPSSSLATAAPTPANPAAMSSDSEFVSCGPSADFAAFSAPSKDLCAKGEASVVTGDGPWSWSCADTSGHKATCSTLAPSGSFSEAMANGTSPKSTSPNEMPAPLAAPTSPVAPALATEEKPSCGSASGQGMASEPTDNLCSVGKASSLHGDGPWTWTCAKGKGKASCQAPKLLDASCGASNGSMQRAMPASNLCNAGSATAVQGSGPWMWSCVGSGGGVSVSCSAGTPTQTRVDGTCGAAASEIATSTPAANLCDSGMPSAVYGNGPWNWTCSGLNGGIASLCSAQKTLPAAPPPPGPVANALCGNANGVAAVVEPEDGLCSAGTPTQTSGHGPWNWNCLGANGGMTVSCTAPLQPPEPVTGICGSATGVSTLVTPKSGLCAAGISSAVNGHGPWTWSCSGTNGGGAVACVAPLAGGAGTGIPSLVTPSASSNTEAPVPQAATTMPVTSVGLVTPHLSTKAPLPPLPPGSAPQIIPSGTFPTAPEASALPPVPVPDETLHTPTMTPDLPEGTKALQPPAVSSSIKPSAALNATGKTIPGNKAVLPDDLSTIGFKPLAENIDNSAIPTLDKLALVLQANSGERITLTSYAGLTPDTSPRDARRLSLTRALAIRDYLTAKGIASARINVRALGVNVPSGDPDRVDIRAE